LVNDPITDEIRAIRRQVAARCGNDLTRIFAELRQKADGGHYVTLPPRRQHDADGGLGRPVATD
jgi:hypothetical protein